MEIIIHNLQWRNWNKGSAGNLPKNWKLACLKNYFVVKDDLTDAQFSMQKSNCI